jgi:hypothetical protein
VEWGWLGVVVVVAKGETKDIVCVCAICHLVPKKNRCGLLDVIDK